MPSITDQTIIDREPFLAKYRLAFLHSVCIQGGMPVDLRAAALREACAMIEVAEAMLPSL